MSLPSLNKVITYLLLLLISLGFTGPEDEVDLILSRTAVFIQPACKHKLYDHLSLTSQKAWFWLEPGIYCEV